MSEDHDEKDKKKIKERNRKIRRAREDELDGIRELLNTRRGRRWVWKVLDHAGTTKLSFNGDPNWAVFNDGRRDVGQLVWADVMDANPDAYVLMRKEAKEDEDGGSSGGSGQKD